MQNKRKQNLVAIGLVHLLIGSLFFSFSFFLFPLVVIVALLSHRRVGAEAQYASDLS